MYAHVLVAISDQRLCFCLLPGNTAAIAAGAALGALAAAATLIVSASLLRRW